MDFCVKTVMKDKSAGEVTGFRYIQYAKRYADMIKDDRDKDIAVIEIREGNDGNGRIVEAFYLK